MGVAILSFYNNLVERGVETWAENVKKNLMDVKIFSGWECFNPFLWRRFDTVIPTNGRVQVLLARLFCKRIIVFGHSGPGADDKWNLWCSPDVFVAFSLYQAKWAERFKYPWTKVKIIPHAVDTEIFKPDNNVKKTTEVLCVAANHPNKRVDLVKKAWNDVMVVGSGQKREVKYQEMPKIYNQVKVFCFVPWAREAFGLVFLEALACNLPIVTIDDPIRREIVGDAGIFVKDPQNTKELSEAIKLALKTDWRDKPRKQSEKFSWSKIVRQYEDICCDNHTG